jgi:mannosyltransferase OCH1-like enzyme
MEKWLEAWDQKNSGTLPESCEENCTIPKSIPPAHYPTRSKIPKIIWQTFKSNRLPKVLYQSVKTCLEQNPEYHYRFFDDNDIAEFIKFWNEEIQRTLCVLNVGAAKADLWRSLAVYEFGGIYLDLDSACTVPFNQWVLSEDDVVTGVGGRGDPHQWFLAYSPHHLFLRVDIVKIVQTIFKFEKNPDDHQRTMEYLTGPPILHKAWDHVLQQSPNPKCQTIFF